jgi:Glycosyltransferase Family 4
LNPLNLTGHAPRRSGRPDGVDPGRRTATGSGLIRVASIPGSHVYVRHLAPVDGGDAVVRLADPVPVDGRKVPGGWWPPVMLDRRWLTDHADQYDVVHLQFGFDAKTPGELCGIVECLDGLGKPLVYTVHDLRNPHHPDRQAHDEQLDVLVPAAAEVVTLTRGAAGEIRQRWGRDAHVISHPHVVDLKTMAAPRWSTTERFVVGIHAKSLRANMDPLPVIDALIPAVAELPGAVLQVNVHDEIFDPSNHWYAPGVGSELLARADRPNVDVRVHPYMTDSELWAYLAALDVSVLAYRFGTHSGWLEACVDLGTAVVAPDCGYYADQRPVHSYRHDETDLDPDTLVAAVRAAYEQRVGYRMTVDDRRSERGRIALAHRALYERVVR